MKNNTRSTLLTTITTTFLFVILALSSFAQKATIKGKIIDKETGETLIGVAVLIEGSTSGVFSDIDGNYVIPNLAPGTYTIMAQYVGYNNFKIENVVAKAGEATEMDFLMVPESIQMEEVVVEARQVTNTDASLLSIQRKSYAVQDGISAQQIGKTGSSNAAESVKQITGASVEDGKYVVMRGLGDRYSTSQLNGMTMVSSDPYRNSASMDLIPSSMLDNIVTEKTFTPDKPGSFTGGNVNITTKSLPDKFHVSLSQKLGYNTQTTGKSYFDTYQGGKTEWLGYDDGTRSMPSMYKSEAGLKNLEDAAPLVVENPNNPLHTPEKRAAYDGTDQFSNQFTPTQRKAPLNSSTNFAIGNRYKLGNDAIGFTLGLNYSREFFNYQNGTQAIYQNTGNERLFEYRNMKENKSLENVQLGGLLGIGYKLGSNNTFGANLLYTNDADKISRVQEGKYIGQVSDTRAIFMSDALEYQQRDLRSLQLMGKHIVSFWTRPEIEWSASQSRASQNEPDIRYFQRQKVHDPAFEVSTEDPNTGEINTRYVDTTLYNMSNAEYKFPQHFYRKLIDKMQQYKIDITVPFGGTSGNKVKLGGAYSDKSRDFEEYNFGMAYPQPPGKYLYSLYEGNNAAFFDKGNFGIVDTLYNPNGSVKQYVLGDYYLNQVNKKNFYTGTERIAAAYAMAVYSVTKKLKAVGGVRMETTNLSAKSRDESVPEGKIDRVDFLPTLNLIYALTENMNLRAAGSRTIARPNMREISPFAQFDTKTGMFILGNPNLKRTSIMNYDLRWEYFPTPGELFAVSGYFKQFDDPIIRRFRPEATIPEIEWNNVDYGRVYGLEFEVRKSLSFITRYMKNFSTSANYTIIRSEQPMFPQEIANAKTIDPSYSTTQRPFQGQAPYIFNGGLSYHSDSAKFEAALSFNISGKKLYTIGQVGTPDIYENPVGMLNFKVSKNLTKNFILSVFMRNLLNPAVRFTQEYKGEEYVAEQYKLGRTFDFTLTFKFD